MECSATFDFDKWFGSHSYLHDNLMIIGEEFKMNIYIQNQVVPASGHYVIDMGDIRSYNKPPPIDTTRIVSDLELVKKHIGEKGFVKYKFEPYVTSDISMYYGYWRYNETALSSLPHQVYAITKDSSDVARIICYDHNNIGNRIEVPKYVPLVINSVTHPCIVYTSGYDVYSIKTSRIMDGNVGWHTIINIMCVVNQHFSNFQLPILKRNIQSRTYANNPAHEHTLRVLNYPNVVLLAEYGNNTIINLARIWEIQELLWHVTDGVDDRDISCVEMDPVTKLPIMFTNMIGASMMEVHINEKDVGPWITTSMITNTIIWRCDTKNGYDCSVMHVCNSVLASTSAYDKFILPRVTTRLRSLGIPREFVSIVRGYLDRKI